ncbi:hypothetical protein [Salinibacter grassmerensis]|uniref:hypothetical protein n=1 Tax=Salinibacter grassmerensis TaxID=3040353 RepID=UPI0021E771BF|nr:hypothetical protein [Salinibacter grassmerensis]
MDHVPYDIEMRGLDAEPGTIDAMALRDLLDAIIDASGRVLRLSVEGRSTRRGRKPDWMTESTQFLVTGLQEGSTVFPIRAPLLKETAEEAVQQQDFWRSKPNGEWTALTLLGDALDDVFADDRESPRYDSGVLSAIESFQRVIENGETLRLRNKNTGEVAFDVNRTHIQQAQRLKQKTPPPFSVVLSGRLDVIEYSQRSFKLKTETGDTIQGVVQSTEIGAEKLGDLWGKEVTVQGQAHFTPAGSLRFVDARALRSAQTGDDFFKQSRTEIEEEASEKQPLSERDLSQFDAGADIKKIRGTWPGDESIDDILSALD